MSSTQLDIYSFFIHDDTLVFIIVRFEEAESSQSLAFDEGPCPAGFSLIAV